MNETRPLLSAGQTLLGRYRVVRPLAEGGMGTVYLAQHVALEMPVAIKLIAAAPTSTRWTILHTRFVREARTLGRMRSEFVCRVLDFGTFEAGEPFVVLEFLLGQSLWTVAEAEQLGRETILDFIAQAIAGLAEAHRWGLVHRDIKPSNLFIASVQGARRQTKVIDFGLVRGSDSDAPVTRGEGLLGTPEFISPEQIDSPHDVDCRTDVWSLGATLFWLLTRELPFEGRTRLGLLGSIVNDPPRMWLFEGTSTPTELREIIAYCLAKKPSDRPGSVGELAERLARLVTGPEGRRALDIARETLRLPPLAVESPEKTLACPAPPATLEDIPAPVERPQPTVSLDYWKGSDKPAAPSSTRARELPVPKMSKRGA